MWSTESEVLCSVKAASLKRLLTGMSLFIWDFEKDKTIGTENRFVCSENRFVNSSWQELGVGGECTYKGAAQGVFWGERKVLYSDCGGDYTDLYMC